MHGRRGLGVLFVPAMLQQDPGALSALQHHPPPQTLGSGVSPSGVGPPALNSYVPSRSTSRAPVHVTLNPCAPPSHTSSALRIARPLSTVTNCSWSTASVRSSAGTTPGTGQLRWLRS